MDFKEAAILSNYISKDYAKEIFRLIKVYKDISASEAASRLDMHIKTVQDFLDIMTQFDIIEKKEVFERKRPYYRYTIKKDKIEIIIDLNKEFTTEEPKQDQFKIREKLNSGAKFSIARNGEYFSTVSVWIGEDRYGKERKFNLTVSQGIFLYYLPFPDAEPLSVEEIFQKTDIENSHRAEVLNIMDDLIHLNVIEKIY